LNFDAGEITPFARRALEEAPRAAVDRLGVERVERRLFAHLEAAADTSRAQELRDLCPVAGATVDDYRPRVVSFADGGRALVHPRFRGGDPAWAFVQWSAADFALVGVDDLRRRAATVLQAYRALRPRCLRIWLRAEGWQPPGEEMGHRLVAAPLANLAVRPNPAVARIPAIEMHTAYVEEYRTYLRHHPEAKAWTHVENLESLQACELFALRDGGRAAGVVALRREATAWFDGWCVVESLMYESYRGRGLAAPMHRAAYALLPAAPDDFVWGTIDPANRASLATARSLGRNVLGGEWWIDPARNSASTAS
jgi:hypothetical protein